MGCAESQPPKAEAKDAKEARIMVRARAARNGKEADANELRVGDLVDAYCSPPQQPSQVQKITAINFPTEKDATVETVGWLGELYTWEGYQSDSEMAPWRRNQWSVSRVDAKGTKTLVSGGVFALRAWAPDFERVAFYNGAYKEPDTKMFSPGKGAMKQQLRLYTEMTYSGNVKQIRLFKDMEEPVISSECATDKATGLRQCTIATAHGFYVLREKEKQAGPDCLWQLLHTNGRLLTSCDVRAFLV